MGNEWVRIFSFDDQHHAADRDKFEAFLKTQKQKFRKETLSLNGAPLPPLEEGGEPIQRTETVFDVPVEHDAKSLRQAWREAK